MNVITGKHLPRRTFLRGLGATVALPFLDASVPAARGWTSSSTDVSDPTRLICIEMVHGSAGACEWGASQNLWSPMEVGHGFDLTPSVLQPLEPYRKYLTIVSDTDVEGAEAVIPKEIGGDHFRSSATGECLQVCRRRCGHHTAPASVAQAAACPRAYGDPL